MSRPEKLTAQIGLTVVGIDVMDTGRLTTQLTGHDAVITAFGGNIQPAVRDYYVRGVNSIINAVKQAGVARLLVVGGAGSLEVAPGIRVMDNPAFPAEWKGVALGLGDILEQLRSEQALDWTFLSPAADIVPGQRIGHFRLGGDQLLVEAAGHSRISIE
ncbi:MAG: NAD(P)H-binding protein, partial [Duganella sp.]